MLLSGVGEDAAGFDSSGQKLWSLILGIKEETAEYGSLCGSANYDESSLLLLLVRELDDGATYEPVDCAFVFDSRPIRKSEPDRCKDWRAHFNSNTDQTRLSYIATENLRN